MGSPAQLFWSLVFGSFGLAYFTYGKKHNALVPFGVGIVLFIFPYFIPNLYAMVGVGAALVVLPYFVRM